VRSCTICEVTYCLVLDESLPIAREGPAALYTLVHAQWREARCARIAPQIEIAPDEFPMPTPRTGPFFCFEKPGRTDLIIGPDKLLGSAQRRVPGVGILQHGSLLLGQRFASHPGVNLGQPDSTTVSRWCHTFAAGLAQALALSATPTTWTAPQLADVARRREQYAGDDWNRRR
jgi:lipoate-protein ligase A